MIRKLLLVLGLVVFAGSAYAYSSLKLIQAKGSVNLSEIGGDRLSVFSLWDNKQGAAVAGDGIFNTVISASRPQKISVKDGRKMTRGLAIVLPEKAQDIIFDARSTAAAVLLSDTGLFSSSAEVEDFSRKMSASRPFQELVIYLKQRLPTHPLEELLQDRECLALLDKCNSDIFRQDAQAIKKSLYEAKDRLEKSL